MLLNRQQRRHSREFSGVGFGLCMTAIAKRHQHLVGIDSARHQRYDVVDLEAVPFHATHLAYMIILLTDPAPYRIPRTAGQLRK